MKYSFHLIAAIGFSSVFSSATASAGLDFSKQVPENIKTQMTQDLGLVDKLEGGKTSSNYIKIFSKDKLIGTELTKFFTKRVHSVDMSDCGGGDGVGACVNPNIDSNKMFLTKNYVSFSIPQIYRISLVFHESRHTENENSNWFHENCPVPYLDENGHDIVGIISGTKMEGRPACDDQNLGAYGLQATLLKNVANACTNCTEKILTDAKIFGDDTVNRISNLAARKQLKDDLEKK
jgi:hypothetical protein